MSRIVTGHASFRGGKDALPIVRSPRNAYLAPHICTQNSSAPANTFVGPRCERADGNEKFTALPIGCSGGFFLGGRASQALSGRRDHSRRQRARRVHINGNDTPARMPHSGRSSSPHPYRVERRDAHHGKSSRHSRGTIFFRRLGPRFCGCNRRSGSMGLDDHAGPI